MKKRIVFCLSLFFVAELYAATKVLIKTNKGPIEVELFDKKAPKTVKNFLHYVNKKHYDNTIFHRVIDNFMIQGGGYTTGLKEKSAPKTVDNEATNGLENNTGTLAMARTNKPHSASAQFFINVKDNNHLNHTSQTPRGWGYAVFGRVVKGMPVVNKIKKIGTKPNGPFRNLPTENVIIESARVIP